MGHPISSSGPTEQQHLSMAFQPKGGAIIARASQHRPSRSISSLPLEKLSKINCEKRTSVSALNSPAASPGAATVLLGETQEKVMFKQTTSIGSILGQSDYSARRNGARRRGGDAPNLSGAESGCESDRKPSSFNLFRGHRRVGSGSNITHKTPTWDSSPRAKLNIATSTTTTRSATASPKKLDKYAVAKIAASLFHSPAGTKLERSQSQRASSSPRRRVEKKRGNHNHALILTAGEVIVPDESPFPTEEESVPRSSSCSVQHMEETSDIPPASKTPSVQTHVNNDTKQEEEAPEAAPPPPMASTPVEESPPPCIPEHKIPSESAVTLNSPVLQTAAEILLEKFHQTSPEDTVSAPQPFCGMPDTKMEIIIPDSPTVSIAALFEDHTVVVEEEEEEEEAHGVDEEEGSTGAAAGDINAFLQIEHSDRGDRRGYESGVFGDDGNSFPTAMCQVAMKETREGDGGRERDGGEDLAAENAIGDCQSTLALLFPTEELPSEEEEEELTEASTQCTISTIDGEVPAIRAPSPPQERPSSPPPPSPFPSEDRHFPDRDLPMKSPPSALEEEPEGFPCRNLPMLRVPSSSSPRLMGLMLQQHQPPQPAPEEPAGSSCGKGGQVKVVHHVVKPTLRKRRRSASGSGLSAMLLKVVRVPEEGTIVTRRFVESPEWGQRQMESPSGPPGDGSGLGRESNGSQCGVCESEPEDAVKSTYSKFVDIEIDPGQGYVELVQYSKDIYHDDTADNTGWKRHPQAAFFERQIKNSPRRLPPVKINTCSVYEGKARARRSKTIRRGRMNSYDLDTLKEYLKTTNSFSAPAQTDATTETPKTPKAPKAPKAVASSPPPPPPPSQAKMDSILTTRERSRTFVSRLQAPSSGAFSYVDVDVYRPCSVSILSNPSFSSSHQDKLWEEQAEIYSSSGRGTPGREEDDDKVRVGDKVGAAQPTHPPQTLLYNLHHHSPLPRFGSIHHQQHEEHPGYNPSLRRSALGSGSLRSPSESSHFMQQIMSKIRGSSPKRVSSSATIARAGSCPTSQLEIAKRRNPWSSCICFSVKS